jgi:hypothetical protein
VKKSKEIVVVALKTRKCFWPAGACHSSQPSRMKKTGKKRVQQERALFYVLFPVWTPLQLRTAFGSEKGVRAHP